MLVNGTGRGRWTLRVGSICGPGDAGAASLVAACHSWKPDSTFTVADRIFFTRKDLEPHFNPEEPAARAAFAERMLIALDRGGLKTARSLIDKMNEPST